jgi:hypothetical protein
MKVLVEDTDRSLFLTLTEQWTPFRELGRNFQTTAAAREHCRACQGRKLGVYLAFDEPRFDTRLEVQSFKPTGLTSPSDNSLAEAKLRNKKSEGKRGCQPGLD